MIDLIIHYKYVAIALSLLAGGTPALLGLIYLVLQGHLSFMTLFLMSIFCTLIWDTIWYITGRYFMSDRLNKYPVFQKFAPLISKYASDHKSWHFLGVIFLSRFIYGTNNIVEILSGVYRIRFTVYILANAISIVLWIGVLYLVSFYVNLSLESFTSHVIDWQIRALIFFLLLLGFYVIFKRVTKKYINLNDK